MDCIVPPVPTDDDEGEPPARRRTFLPARAGTA